jgi:hypothetical protein
MEDAVSKYMKMTMDGLKLLRGKGIRGKFPKMSGQFESDLGDEMTGNPYQPAKDGGNSYRKPGEDEEEEEDRRGRAESMMTRQERAKVLEAQRIIAEDKRKRMPDADGIKREITASAALEPMNRMRARYGLPGLEVVKKKR